MKKILFWSLDVDLENVGEGGDGRWGILNEIEMKLKKLK